MRDAVVEGLAMQVVAGEQFDEADDESDDRHEHKTPR
jgi:hypothetical protein